MRLICLLLAALATFSLQVNAQVATPSILTATIDFATINPAAIQWGFPSAVGGAYGTGSGSKTITGTPTSLTVISTQLGFRLVNDRMGLAAQQSRQALTGTGVSETYSATRVGLSLGLWERLALGIGLDNTKNEQMFTLEGNAKSAGFSLRLFEGLFVAASAGEETLTLAQSGLSSSDKRAVNSYGVAYRSGGAIQSRLEYYMVYGRQHSLYTPSQTHDYGTSVELAYKALAIGYDTLVFDHYYPGRRDTVTLAWNGRESMALSASLVTESYGDNLVATTTTSRRLALAFPF